VVLDVSVGGGEHGVAGVGLVGAGHGSGVPILQHCGTVP
jgi:hypothetical protein